MKLSAASDNDSSTLTSGFLSTQANMTVEPPPPPARPPLFVEDVRSKKRMAQE